MNAFTTYFDESGTHRDSPVFVIAGWMASDDQWKLLNEEWRRILDKHGVTVFHMTDFAHRKGEYRNLSEDCGNDLLSSLVDSLLGRVAVGVFGAIHLPSYYEIINENPNRGMVFGNPFTLVGLFSIDAFRRWADEKNFHEPTAYVYEAGANHAGQFEDAYKRAVKKDKGFAARHRHKSFRFGKKPEIPLQAADLLAYQVHVGLRNIEIEGTARGITWPLQQFVTREFAPYGVYYDRDKLRGYVLRTEGSEGTGSRSVLGQR